jgi:enamine deaminase RidA (YjgF/YER057c/UK114 family)
MNAGLALAVVLLTGSVAGVASAQTAAPTITRKGPANFPISSITVVHGVGGVDIAYASGIPGAAADGDTKAQTIVVLTKMTAVLKSEGFGLGDVVMMRVFLAGDPAMAGKMDFAGMNAAFSQFFGTADQPNKPSRTTVQIASLVAPGSMVEIEAQAVKPHS